MSPQNSETNTEVSTEVIHLGAMLKRVISGSILIPRFQRPFVWKANQMLDLLDSVRFGFPILDRVGHRAFPLLGYTGAMRLIEQITNVLLDKEDRENPDHEMELIQ